MPRMGRPLSDSSVTRAAADRRARPPPRPSLAPVARPRRAPVAALALLPLSTLDMRCASRLVVRRDETVVAGRSMKSLALEPLEWREQYHELLGTSLSPMQYVWLDTEHPRASHIKSTCSSSPRPQISHRASFTSRSCAAMSWSCGSGRKTCLQSAIVSVCVTLPLASTRVTWLNFVLQSGHRFVTFDHATMHSKWNLWSHTGRKPCVSSSTTSRQMQHCDQQEHTLR